MNPRNLFIAGGFILALVVAVFLLLPEDPGPVANGNTGGGGTGYESGVNSVAGGTSTTESPDSGGTGSGSGLSGVGSGSQGKDDRSPTGRRFRAGDQPANGTEGSFGSDGDFESKDTTGNQGNKPTTSRGPGRSRGNSRGGSSRAGSGTVPEGMVRVYGQVVVENTPEAGPSLSGHLQIGVSQESRSIPVSKGQFATNIPQSASIRFFSAMLEGKPARVISPTTPLAAGSTGSVRVVVRYDALAILHLLSAETGQELTDVEVVRAKDYTRSSLPHPGWALPQDSRITAEESPVALDGRIGLSGSAVAIHARAAGHEWKRVTVDLVDGGERELTLQRSGALNLIFVGDAEREGVMLRLREIGVNGAPYLEVPVTAGTTQLVEGVLSGSWRASLEAGHWAHQPEVFDEIEFDLIVGDLLELQLEIPLDDEERVEVAGSVFIPAGWYLNFFSVRIRPTGPGSDPIHDTVEIPNSAMESEAGDNGTLWYWGPVLVKQGTYGILILPVGYGDLFEVGEEGLSDVYIELPQPVDISVQTMLADGSGVATPNLIRWAPVHAPGVPGAGAVPVGSGENGYFEFQVPIGSVMLSCSDVAYRPKHQVEQVTPGGDNAFTMLLEPAMGMLLYLEEQGTSVPWDLQWHPTIQAQGHGGTVVTRGRTGVGYRVLVSDPGPYVVAVGQLPGFLPVAPFEVMVGPSEVLDTVIELESE